MAKNMTFEITNDRALKLEDGLYYDLSMLYNEINTLVNNHTVNPGLKYNYKPNGQYVYSFITNIDNSLYQNHGIERIKIKVNNNDNNNIEYLDNLTNNVKSAEVYKTSQDLYSIGIINGFLVNGYSIVTYATEKNSKGLGKKEASKKKSYHKDLSKFLIF